MDEREAIAQKFTLDLLSLQHLDQLVELERSCFGGYWTRQGLQEELCRLPRDARYPDRASSIVVGAWLRHGLIRLVGFVGLWSVGCEAHIIMLGVHPECRRRGLGRWLVQDVLKRAAADGLEWTTLEVRESNIAASRLYQSLGFEQLGVRKRYYTDPEEDALILWKRL